MAIDPTTDIDDLDRDDEDLGDDDTPRRCRALGSVTPP
jgi:hypothetical protein